MTGDQAVTGNKAKVSLGVGNAYSTGSTAAETGDQAETGDNAKAVVSWGLKGKRNRGSTAVDVDAVGKQ